MKFVGPAADAADEVITKGDMDTKFAAADGSGLTESGGVLAVGAGSGITVNADDVALASSSAGDGLTYTTGVLAVGAGTGVTVAANDVAVSANYRSIPVPIHITGTLTTGVKLPEFIAPVAMTVVDMRGRCSSGSSATYRPSKNGGTSDGTTSAGTAQSVVATSQSVSLAASDRLGINIVAAGTGSDLSVTFWVSVD